MSENADFIQSLYGAFAKGDIATILAALTPDATRFLEIFDSAAAVEAYRAAHAAA